MTLYYEVFKNHKRVNDKDLLKIKKIIDKEIERRTESENRNTYKKHGRK